MAKGKGMVKLVGYAPWLDTMNSGKEQFGSMGEPTYTVGSNAYYAVYQEYGTYKMAAQPHLRPATQKTRQAMDSYFQKAATPREALRRAAADLASETQRRAPVDTGNLRATYSPPTRVS